MLKEFDDLISTLCANSSIVRKERDGRLFFTIGGILFDSFWYSTDNYRFGTSERPSRVGATLRTPSTSSHISCSIPVRTHYSCIWVSRTNAPNRGCARGFVVDHSRSRCLSTPHVGRMGEASLDGTIAAGPNRTKGASHVGRVS